jgi:hypothetical protein
MRTGALASAPGCIIEAPWLVNGGHGASLRHHKGISAEDAHRRAGAGAGPGDLGTACRYTAVVRVSEAPQVGDTAADGRT